MALSFALEVAGQSPKGLALPDFDFSRSGYHLGKALPDRSLEGKKVFKVVDFGAVPNDGKDDVAAIQRAVDQAEKEGGGVVLFPPGVFDFDVDSAQHFVRIRASGILLRGYGDGLDGTHLHDHLPSRSPDPSQKWLGGQFPSFFKVGKDFSIDTLPAFPLAPAPKATSSLSLVSGSLRPGLYALLMDNPADTSLAFSLAFPLRDLGRRHAGPGTAFLQMVRVSEVSGKSLMLESPIHWELKSSWKPRLVRLEELCLQEVGIENFRLISDFKEPFYHHKDDVHDSGWDQIKFHGVEHGWVRNITHVSPSMAVALTLSKNCVVYDCRIIGNPGHNGFLIGKGSTQNLLMRLQGGGAMHTWSISGFASGNVFHLCMSDQPSAIDCHGTLAVWNLFDQMYGTVVANGGGPGALPPAHGRGLVLYNIQAGTLSPYNHRIQTRFLSMRNYPGLWVLGLRTRLGFDLEIVDGKGRRFLKDFTNVWGTVFGFNAPADLPFPSLYGHQRQKRYGTSLPEEPELLKIKPKEAASEAVEE
jgi:hypothetical protein